MTTDTGLTAYPTREELLRGGDAATYRYRVELVRVASPDVVELGLAPVGTPMHHRPGQYALVGSLGANVPERAYSIANAPRPDGRVRLLVTRHRGGATSGWIHDELSRGDEVTLTGPGGALVADPALHGPVLLLAAGCGVAPVSAIAETLLAEQPDRPVTLHFSGRTSAHVLQRARFESMARRHPQFTYLVTLTRDHTLAWPRRVPEVLGRMTTGDLSGWEVFIAGNESFVRDCRAEALRLGAAPTSVHTEEFLSDMPMGPFHPVS